MRPHSVKSGIGSTYRYAIDFTVRASELRPGRDAALIEYTTQKGEELLVHTYFSEDEIFYALQGVQPKYPSHFCEIRGDIA
jgi:hypothetical protein